jgi:hypothetical protein
MPVEVALCRYSPEVSVVLQRLLADRWWELEDPAPMLETVPEDECLMVDESGTVEAFPGLPNEQVSEPCF